VPTYVIEREIPDAGKLTPEQLAAIARQSNGVVDELGDGYRWVHSYVADDRIICVHEAPDEQTVRTHARMGGFPADRIDEVRGVIDPETARGGVS
jgi:hypothetical protein